MRGLEGPAGARRLDLRVSCKQQLQSVLAHLSPLARGLHQLCGASIYLHCSDGETEPSGFNTPTKQPTWDSNPRPQSHED